MKAIICPHCKKRNFSENPLCSHCDKPLNNEPLDIQLTDEATLYQEFVTDLPEMKQALGNDWGNFVNEMKKQAALFESITNTEALARAVDELLIFFLANEVVSKIITSSEYSSESIRAPQPKSGHDKSRVIEIKMLANEFYLLCRNPDKLIDQTQATPNKMKDGQSNRKT